MKFILVIWTDDIRKWKGHLNVKLKLSLGLPVNDFLSFESQMKQTWFIHDCVGLFLLSSIIKVTAF